jgi:hypothetical protein
MWATHLIYNQTMSTQEDQKIALLTTDLFPRALANYARFARPARTTKPLEQRLQTISEKIISLKLSPAV